MSKTSSILKLSGLSLLAATSQVIFVPNALASTPLSTKEHFEGKVNYTVTGGTLRSNPDGVNSCSLNSSSSAQLTGIPGDGAVKKAYLYWAGSGTSVDNQVDFEGSSLTADNTYTDTFNSTYSFFQGVKDVTNIVANKGNGTYEFSGLSVDSGSPYCNVQGVLSGWSLIVVYEDPTIPEDKLNTIEFYEGFTVSRNQSVDYTLDGIQVAENPEAKFSMLIWEGDQSLGGSNEFFSFNDNTLSDSYNPSNNQFNSSINTLQSSDTYGVDLDTFDVSSYVSAGDTSVTGTISTNDDLVLQGAALMIVTDELANRSPSAQPDTIVTDEDNPGEYNLIDGDPDTGDGKDTDPEGDSLILTKVNVDGTEYLFDAQISSHDITMSSGALLTVEDNGDVIYDPNGKFEELDAGETASQDSFTYTVEDPEGEESSAVATVNVNGAPDDPEAQDDEFTTDENTVKEIHVLENDSDPNTDRAELRVTEINNTPVGLNGTYKLDSGAEVTVVEVPDGDKSQYGDYTLEYDPTESGVLDLLNDGDTETETFTYTVEDPEGNTGEASVTVTVDGITDTFPD